MRALDAAHKAEVRELLQKWNSIVVPNFENEAALLEIELRKRHQNELEQFRRVSTKVAQMDPLVTTTFTTAARYSTSRRKGRCSDFKGSTKRQRR
jgi:hypothetical protein